MDLTADARESRCVPVSVIVPYYNSGKTLDACIASINANTRPCEIVLVDDGSTDDSLLTAERIAREHTNIQIVRRPENGGILAARRDGFIAAKHEWIAFVDSDDTVEPDAVASAYEIATGTNADMCVWQLWRRAIDKEWCAISLEELKFPLSGPVAAALTIGGWKMHPLGVARRSLYLSAYDGFHEATANADELLTRVVLQNAGIIMASPKKYFYTVNPDSHVNSFRPRRLTFLYSSIWLLRFCDDHSIPKQNEVIDLAIEDGWLLWARRYEIGRAETKRVLRSFLPRLFIKGSMWRAGRRSRERLARMLSLWMRSCTPGN